MPDNWFLILTDTADSWELRDYTNILLRRWPLTILASTNLTGVVGSVQDDPDSPDTSWITMSN